MHVQTVLVDASWLHNVWEMFLPFIKFRFLWKNGVSEKIKTPPRSEIYPQNLSTQYLVVWGSKKQQRKGGIIQISLKEKPF